jgi:hypothetical protein
LLLGNILVLWHWTVSRGWLVSDDWENIFNLGYRRLLLLGYSFAVQFSGLSMLTVSLLLHLGWHMSSLSSAIYSTKRSLAGGIARFVGR